MTAVEAKVLRLLIVDDNDVVLDELMQLANDVLTERNLRKRVVITPLYAMWDALATVKDSDTRIPTIALCDLYPIGYWRERPVASKKRLKTPRRPDPYAPTSIAAAAQDIVESYLKPLVAEYKVTTILYTYVFAALRDELPLAEQELRQTLNGLGDRAILVEKTRDDWRTNDFPILKDTLRGVIDSVIANGGGR